MQPYFFPYIGYWQLLHAVDKFIIYDDVNFIKKGWINRNNILENGKASLFSIPLSGASQNKKINEIPFFEPEEWSRKFLSQIKSAYSKAPYFQQIEELLREILTFENSENISIVKVFSKHIESIAKYLEIDFSLAISSEKYKNTQLKGQSRIIDICIQESAKRYINLIGGKALYTSEDFKENDIELSFLESKPIGYKQFDNEFVPCLSIIDVLMFNSKEEVKQQLNQFQLV